MRKENASLNAKVNAKVNEKATNQLNIVKLLNDTEIKNAIKWAVKTYLRILVVTSPLWILAINYLVK